MICAQMWGPESDWMNFGKWTKRERQGLGLGLGKRVQMYVTRVMEEV